VQFCDNPFCVVSIDVAIQNIDTATAHDATISTLPPVRLLRACPSIVFPETSTAASIDLQISQPIPVQAAATTAAVALSAQVRQKLIEIVQIRRQVLSVH
jgi:hypothetical protein